MQKSRPSILLAVGISLTRSRAVERKERKWSVGKERKGERKWERKSGSLVPPFSTTFTFPSISSEPIDFIPSFHVLFPHIDVFVEQPELFTGKLHATVKIYKRARLWQHEKRERRLSRRARGEESRGRGDDEVVVYALYPMHENFGSRESLLLRWAKKGRSSTLGWRVRAYILYGYR